MSLYLYRQEYYKGYNDAIEETKGTYKNGYNQGRRDVIDEFVKEIKRNSTILRNENGVVGYYEYAISISDVEKIAKKIKGDKIYD